MEPFWKVNGLLCDTARRAEEEERREEKERGKEEERRKKQERRSGHANAPRHIHSTDIHPHPHVTLVRGRVVSRVDAAASRLRTCSGSMSVG